VYGFVAGDNVLRFTAMLLTEVLDDLGTPNDFVGHAGGDNFVITTSASAAPQIKQRLKDRFAKGILAHYTFVDRSQGFMLAPRGAGPAEHVPFMTLSVGMVSATQQKFSDIREITEAAAEARRQDSLATA
jgi:GGDEF domain-containing protein